MHKHQSTLTHTLTLTLPFLRKVQCAVRARQQKKEQTDRLINNSVTLPSPLRSSAESRRACRKRDSRGGGGRQTEAVTREKEREREKQRAERRREGEREERG